jgi:hypothetical protein
MDRSVSDHPNLAANDNPNPLHDPATAFLELHRLRRQMLKKDIMPGSRLCGANSRRLLVNRAGVRDRST